MSVVGEPDKIRIVIIIFIINVTIIITCEPGSIDIIGALIFGARTQENSVAVRWKEVCASVFALQIGDND